jgi:hypothetical protein
MESSNNIIHPTRPKGLGFGSNCFGRVMISVRHRQEASVVGISTYYFLRSGRAGARYGGRRSVFRTFTTANSGLLLRGV